jgi:predicted Zn finger-like uncharacterized protein
MSTQQATRCPNCATVFRVATAQLQAYEGWVRCGRCAEVFNAESCLVELDTPPVSGTSGASAAPVVAPPATRSVDFDLDFDVPATPATPAPPAQPVAASSMVRAASGLAPAYHEDNHQDNMVERAVKAMRTPPPSSPALEPPAWPQPAPAQPPVAPDFGPVHEPPAEVQMPAPVVAAAAAPLPPAPIQQAAPTTQLRIEPAFDAPAPPPAATAAPTPAPTPLPAVVERAEPQLPAARVDAPPPDDFAADPRWMPYADPAPADGALAAAPGGHDAPASAPGDWRDQPLPSFVQKADRAARWRSPKVRLALTTVCLLSLLGLLVQATHEYRDVVAARFEATRPLLERGCALLGCRVGAPRALDADGVSVESSGLVRVDKTNTYKLNIALRNRASLAVAVPALELSLTDAQGKLMSRRVLRAADFGVTQASVAAGRDLSLQATVQTAFATVNNEAQEPVAGYTIELFYP